MPVVRRTGATTGGVYAVVRERIEADARNHAGWCAGRPNPPPYPLQRALDALRAGEATDVPAWAIPKRYRADHCTARGRRSGETFDSPWIYKAIVHPEDRVTFEPDDGSAMIEYLGL